MKLARTLSLCCLLVTMTAGFAHADGKMADATKMAAAKVNPNSIPAILEANERKVMESIKAKDIVAFKSMVDAGGWSIDPSGVNPVSTVPDMMKAFDIKSYTMDNYRTQMIDRDAFIAIFNLTSDATMGGQPHPSGPWYCSTVWRKDGTAWKAIFHTETLAMQPPPATSSDTAH